MALVDSKSLPIGWKARDFRLPATDGYEYALRAFSDKPGLLLVFTCNHCPYAKASWPLLIELAQKYEKTIGVVAINPNDEDEYPEDSMENMKKLAEKLSLPFPYLRDQSQEIAKQYEAQCTPDIYLFSVKDVSFSLFYHGRINDNWKNTKKAKEHNLEYAIKALVAGKEPPKDQPPSMGCSIKWKS